MVLLPGCTCCATVPCQNLATFYNSATRLELDIEAYDWERNDVYATQNLFCNQTDGSTVTGRTSSPWSAINGSYSLTKIFSSSTGSAWRYEFPSPCSGVFGFLDPPRVDVQVSASGLFFRLLYIQYRACDYLGGSISDTCTANTLVCSGSPVTITQRYSRSPATQERVGNLNCIDGVWASTEIGVTTNEFPSPAFSADIAVPAAYPCTQEDEKIQFVSGVSSSTSGNSSVKIKNLKFFF